MKREREGRMVLAYLAGTSQADLAAQHRVSTQRVAQILNYASWKLGHGRGIHRHRDSARLMLRAREYYRPPELRQFEPDTPEAFFYELLSEPRQVTL